MSSAKLVTVAFGDPCWDVHTDPASSETVCISQNRARQDHSNSMPEPRSSSLSLCCLRSNPILSAKSPLLAKKGKKRFPRRGSFWAQPIAGKRKRKAPCIAHLREPQCQREIAGQHSTRMTLRSHFKIIWLLPLSGLSLSPLPHLPTMPLPYPISQTVVSG